jgi:hypothetical protein
MAETPGRHLYDTHLKAHRLVPASKEEAQPKAWEQVDILPEREAARSYSGESQDGIAAREVQALAAQAESIASGVEPLLERLAVVLEALEVSEAAQQSLALLRSILKVLPDELANGLHAMIGHVDWAFLRMLNQPGQPGLIERVLIALGAPSEDEAPDPGAGAYQTEIEGLRQLHRDLVSLQQGWDALVETFLPVSPPPEASAPRVDVPRPRQPEVPALKQGIALKKRPAVSPAAPVAPVTPTRPEDGIRPTPAHWLHRARTMRVRVALALGLLFFLVVSGMGMLVVKGSRFPTVNQGTAVVSVHQPSPPGATATPTLAPIFPQQSPTSFAASLTPAPPLQPTSVSQTSPTPTAVNFWCPSAGQLCVSSLLLQVPCAGQGDATLQLKNNTTQTQSWQATASKMRRGPLVTLSASRGQLQPGQVVTLTIVAANPHQHLEGMLAITNSGSKGQTLVGLVVCD